MSASARPPAAIAGSSRGLRSRAYANDEREESRQQELAAGRARLGQRACSRPRARGRARSARPGRASAARPVQFERKSALPATKTSTNESGTSTAEPYRATSVGSTPASCDTNPIAAVPEREGVAGVQAAVTELVHDLERRELVEARRAFARGRGGRARRRRPARLQSTPRLRTASPSERRRPPTAITSERSSSTLGETAAGRRAARREHDQEHQGDRRGSRRPRR